jgi:3',5'-cyclic AMP phosphodiesterase CpdA
MFVLVVAAFPVFAGESFMFVQLSDPQFGLGGYRRDVLRFEQAIRQINELKPDFVVVCGDLVNQALLGGTLEHFAKEKSALAMPCYCVPGNHDIGAVSVDLLARYRRVIGHDYYEIEHKGRVFLMVNSELWAVNVPEESQKHEEWFKTSLEKASAAGKPVFVVAHRPLYVANPDEPSDVWNIPLEKRRELLGWMERYGAVAWLSGHIHTDTVNDFKGMQLVSSVTTSVSFFERPFGFHVWHIGDARPYKEELVCLDLSKLNTGKDVTGTVSGLRNGEECVVVVLSGRHTPQGQWTIESLLRLEQQSWVLETAKDGKFAAKGIPQETVTVVAIGLMSESGVLQTRFETRVLEPSDVGAEPLLFVFKEEK